MKRIVSILLAVMLLAAALGFAGCGKGYSVYGRVADELGQGIANVTITFSGGYSGTTTSDADGNWSKDGLKGTVLVIPSRIGWTFTPTNKQVTKAATGVDFVATLFETPELTDDRFNEIIYQVDHITQLFNDMPSDLAVDQALIELSEDEQIYACGTLDSGTEVWWTTLEGIGCESGPIPEGINNSDTTASLKSKTLEDGYKAVEELALASASSGTYIGNYNVIGFSPFHRTWPDIDQVPIISDMLEEAGFNVTTPLYDDACTVETFRDLGGYGIINISTHGGSSQINHPEWINQDQTPQVRFMTGEVVSSESKAEHKEDLEVGRLIIRGVKDDPNQYFSIMPQFIKDYWSPMPETLVFLEICHGADSNTMWDQMEQKGAEVCFAYYGLCYVSYAKDDAINIFTCLLLGDDCGTAFEKTLSENDFRMLGNGDLKLDYAITFEDPNLEAVVRSTIGKPTGQLMKTDVLNITTLDAGECGISRLGGINHLSSLGRLILDNNSIENLKELASLKKLQWLNLSKNAVVDISPLADLLNIERLELSDNQITNIDAISGLTNITTLDIQRNHITDIEVLQSLPMLTSLLLSENPIADFNVLADFTNLTSLVLQKSDIVDIDFLVNLTNLKTIILDNNQITDISVLADLTNLKNVILWSNQITNIDALANLTNLAFLDIDDNQISDISALVNNLGLGTEDNVYMRDNLLDLSPGSDDMQNIITLQNRGVIVIYQW